MAGPGQQQQLVLRQLVGEGMLRRATTPGTDGRARVVKRRSRVGGVRLEASPHLRSQRARHQPEQLGLGDEERLRIDGPAGG